MKRKLLVLSVLVISIAIAAVGTLAYFNVEEKAHNVITTGGVDIAIHEWADEDKTEPFTDITGIMPNMTATKKAEVKNTGRSEAWVRVQVTKEIALQGQGTSDPALVELDLNTKVWKQGEGGYLYYDSPLKPGEVTAPIFTTVRFHQDMGNEYQNATIKVDVTAQAVQTANNGKSALEAAGWPNA